MAKTRFRLENGQEVKFTVMKRMALKLLGQKNGMKYSTLGHAVKKKMPEIAHMPHRRAIVEFVARQKFGCSVVGRTQVNRQRTKSKVVSIRPNLPRETSAWIPRKEYENFYNTREWKELRYLALRNSEGRCGCCGARASDGVQLHVDHIKPRASRPDLQLALDNLQVLCSDCNIGKGAWDDTDWREHMRAIKSE